MKNGMGGGKRWGRGKRPKGHAVGANPPKNVSEDSNPGSKLWFDGICKRLGNLLIGFEMDITRDPTEFRFVLPHYFEDLPERIKELEDCEGFTRFETATRGKQELLVYWACFKFPITNFPDVDMLDFIGREYGLTFLPEFLKAEGYFARFRPHFYE